MLEREKSFAGKPIRYFELGKKLPNPSRYAISITDCADSHPDKATNEKTLNAFFTSERIEAIETLVISGTVERWHGEKVQGTPEALDWLVEHKDKLPNLTSLFLGNISCDELELSWINEKEIAPVLQSFPQLKYLKLRGASTFTNCRHAQLESLTVELAGADRGTVQELMAADLPELKHLEFWIGGSFRCELCKVKDFEPMWLGKQFRKIETLKLPNNEKADKFLKVIARWPRLKQIKVLDLAWSTLRDEDMEPLFASPYLSGLTHLNLRHNYLSSSMVRRLKKHPALQNCQVSASVQRRPDDGERYVFVSE